MDSCPLWGWRRGGLEGALGHPLLQEHALLPGPTQPGPFSSEQARRLQRKWSAAEHLPVLGSLQGWAVRRGPSWFRGGDTLGRAVLTGSPQGGGRRVPAAGRCAQAPAPASVPAAGGRADGRSHMMSDNDTSRCLNPTPRLSSTMSPPGHPARRVLRGANAWPHTPRALAAVATLRASGGAGPVQLDRGPGRRAPRAGWRAGDVTGRGGWVTRR